MAQEVNGIGDFKDKTTDENKSVSSKPVSSKLAEAAYFLGFWVGCATRRMAAGVVKLLIDYAIDSTA